LGWIISAVAATEGRGSFPAGRTIFLFYGSRIFLIVYPAVVDAVDIEICSGSGNTFV